MRTTPRIVGFVAALAAVFALALVVGRAVGPVTQPVGSSEHDHEASEPMSPDTHMGMDGASIPGGLMVSQRGYTLSLADDTVHAGPQTPIEFSIDGPNGLPLTSFEVAHGRLLHLIAVRRDFAGYQHVHPVMTGAGVWTTQLDLSSGQWRLFADFTTEASGPLTLGVDLAVSGHPGGAPVIGDRRVVTVDGYTVSLDGTLVPEDEAMLRLTVSHDGQPVTSLQPYLGSYGHLVALRAGDLAYLHVHPDGFPGDGITQPGPQIVFHAAVPSVGAYHLYFDFKVDGVVRTAAFTLTAASS